jgi:hypothetical protein
MTPRRLKKTGVLKFRIDLETHASLKRYCALTEQSMSVVMRDLLERELVKAPSSSWSPPSRHLPH